MPRKSLQKLLPHPDKLRAIRGFGIFGDIIFSPNLWHLNRSTVSGAFFVGLFCAFIPVPFQMLIAAGLALVFRINLPIAVSLVWITNPFTMGPIFFFCYLVGAWLINTPIEHVDFEISLEWLTTTLLIIWQPFLLGCFIVGISSGIIGFIFIRIIWRIIVAKNWNERKLKRRKKWPYKKRRSP